jgi:hypothetical protein
MSSTPRGEIALRAVLVVLGVITTIPALALVDVSALDSGYGVTDPDPMTLALLQHRGMFQLLLGAAIIWSAFHRPARLAVALGAVISKSTFLFLTLSNETTRGDIPPYTIAFDATCIVVLAGLAVAEIRAVHRHHRSGIAGCQSGPRWIRRREKADTARVRTISTPNSRHCRAQNWDAGT